MSGKVTEITMQMLDMDVGRSSNGTFKRAVAYEAIHEPTEIERLLTPKKGIAPVASVCCR